MHLILNGSITTILKSIFDVLLILVILKLLNALIWGWLIVFVAPVIYTGLLILIGIVLSGLLLWWRNR